MMEEEALKSYQGELMGKAMASVELASKIKEKYAESWIMRTPAEQSLWRHCTATSIFEPLRTSTAKLA